MNYAKVNGTTLLLYPYSMENLLAENPYTNYDDRFDVKEWYSKTEEALSSGNEIVDVTIEPPLDDDLYDAATQFLIYDDTPNMKNGNWVLSTKIVDKSDEEIARYNNSLNSNSTI